MMNKQQPPLKGGGCLFIFQLMPVSKVFLYGLCLINFLILLSSSSDASPLPELADANADAGFKSHHQIVFTNDDFVDEALDHISVVMAHGA